jgi:hypothetical protein
MDYSAIGDTTNLAARLEALAPPGTVLISEATHRLVRGLFAVEPAGPLAVKGKRERVVAYRVLARAEAATSMTIVAGRRRGVASRGAGAPAGAPRRSPTVQRVRSRTAAVPEHLHDHDDRREGLLTPGRARTSPRRRPSG